jgi:glycosyltransferase involved in cell wall biosynthesis
MQVSLSAVEPWRPAVSVLLPTRDRPDFLPVALECARRQRYPNRELIVLDHGERTGVESAAVEAAGGRVIRVDPSLSLGEALNIGVADAAGLICCKIDDDDWYGADYLDTMIGRVVDQWRGATTSFYLAPYPFLMFDVAAWEVRSVPAAKGVGAAMCFLRTDAIASPFRPVPAGVDTLFANDLFKMGVRSTRVEHLESFVAVRHGGPGANRGHTWRRWVGDRTVEEAMTQYAISSKQPEELIEEWALPFYRDLHRRLVNAGDHLGRA